MVKQECETERPITGKVHRWRHPEAYLWLWYFAFRRAQDGQLSLPEEAAEQRAIYAYSAMDWA